MKKTITYLRATGRRLMGLVKKLIGKAAHQGALKVGVTIGFPLSSRSPSTTMRHSGRRPTMTTRASQKPADLQAALSGAAFSSRSQIPTRFALVYDGGRDRFSRPPDSEAGAASATPIHCQLTISLSDGKT